METLRIDATKLQCIMADKGLGMVQLANDSGIMHKTLKRAITSGSTAKTVGKVAKALNMPVSEIIVKKEIEC